MSDKNIDLFRLNHSSKRIKLAARKLDGRQAALDDLPGDNQEQPDIM